LRVYPVYGHLYAVTSLLRMGTVVRYWQVDA